MTALAKELDQKLALWKPEQSAMVERMVTEIIQLADADALDVLGSREVEQEVIDLLDGH